MNRKEFLNDIKTEFQWLIDLGYKYSVATRTIRFTKKFNKDDYILEISWIKCNDYVISVLCAKKFYQIERVIKERTGHYNHTIYKNLNRIELPNEFSSILMSMWDMQKFRISENYEIALFSKAVKFLYEQYVIAFFEQYQRVENIMDWLAKTEISKHQSLLSSSNNLSTIRELIIMKQTNYDGFDDLYDNERNFLQEKFNEQETPFVEMFETLKKFDDYFLN